MVKLSLDDGIGFPSLPDVDDHEEDECTAKEYPQNASGYLVIRPRVLHGIVVLAADHVWHRGRGRGLERGKEVKHCRCFVSAPQPRWKKQGRICSEGWTGACLALDR